MYRQLAAWTGSLAECAGDSPPLLRCHIADPVPLCAASAAVSAVTVLSGFLGSGKTTIILNLIKQISSEYKVGMGRDGTDEGGAVEAPADSLWDSL